MLGLARTVTTVLTAMGFTPDKSCVLRVGFSAVLNCTLRMSLSQIRSSVMNRLRILVADDHEIVRRGLVAMIKSHPDWEICAEADNGRQAVEQAKQSKPDIAILDIGMPVLNGLEATRQILRE